MDVKIYRPSKSVTQSGRGLREAWVLEYELETPREAEPIMGWTGSGDTLNQVLLKFKSCDDAVAFAEDKGWGHSIIPDHNRRVKPRNYGDNFKYITPID